MDLASSSSSFSKSKPRLKNDVFINFRGEDTRRKFVSHLYHALSKNAGVKTFFDEENLLKGMVLRELMPEIEGSQIAIVVFSESYTRSTWCLDELAKIIECHETYGQIILPVFYYIDPSDVRYQTGDFGTALKEVAAKRYSGVHMEHALFRWSRALSIAASISGWEASKYRNEAELVKKIVEDVLKKLEYDVLSITEFPVGLESRVQNVIRLIEKQSNKVCIIGIWGMGGLGKTTTAKAIYNRIHRTFMKKSFIEDIREVCRTDGRGLVLLQKKLLLNVLKTELVINTIGEGKTMIKERLSGKQVLLVFDDVNELGQLQHLCGNHEWFGPETVVIITTRDVRLLYQFKVDNVYRMEEMDENESLELFSWYAFEGEKPREDFNELTRNIVSYCGGLPVALEALGSDLCGRTKKEWESTLSKLESIPNTQVQKILSTSYVGLDDHMQQDIFLDVCCFFIGKDRAYVTEILDGCELHPNIGIPILIERSLIKVEKNNKLGMHNLLREMGREIIRESSRKKPGMRSRLWFNVEVVEVLRKNTGTESVEGLALLNFSTRDYFEAYAFKNMQSLRLLQLENVQLNGDYGYLSKKLRWICWQGFPSKYIPKSFNLESVIAIDLKRSNLRLVWKEPQDLKCLKVLNLSHSEYLTETPNFLKVPNLEKLILKHCPRLCKLHKSIGDLSNLVLINLKGCKSLGNLPRSVYKLKFLKTLILSDSKIEKLEEDIVQMESLETLKANNIAVKQVPFSIVRLKSIGYVSLCEHEGLSRNVFPSIIWSWMCPTMNLLCYIHPLRSISSYLVSLDIQNNVLGDLAPMLGILCILRSVSVQYETEFQLSEQVKRIMEDVYGANFTELQKTSYTSQTSTHSLRSYLIGIGTGTYKEVFNSLSNSISEGLSTTESGLGLLPGNNEPYWLAHMNEEHSVYFTMPEDCHTRGMALCVVYSSTPELVTDVCLTSVLVVNYTKCTIRIHKRDTVISLNDVYWQGIVSHLGSGDNVVICPTFDHELVIKKTAVYLMCDESIDMEM